MTARTDPNLTDKLCCMILLHLGIPHDIAKDMTREDILRLVEWDHSPVAVKTAVDLGWGKDRYNHPSNLHPRLEDWHGIKTATIDRPALAKDDRIERKHKEHRQRMLAKAGGEDGGEQNATAKPRPTKSQWPERKNKWPKRTMQNRPFRRLPP